MANSYFTRNGFTPLDGKCGSGNCFDGVYVKGNTVYINEVKPLNANGSIKLSGASTRQNGSELPPQMTLDWIDYARIELSKSTNPQARATAAVIQKAIDNQTLVRVVSGINANGMTIVKLTGK